MCFVTYSVDAEGWANSDFNLIDFDEVKGLLDYQDGDELKLTVVNQEQGSSTIVDEVEIIIDEEDFTEAQFLRKITKLVSELPAPFADRFIFVHMDQPYSKLGLS